MHDFLVRELLNTDIKNEIEYIGYDKSYSNIACKKFEYKNLKVFNVTSAQANIIKQLALSVGADCATNKDCITGKSELSDCIIGGSYPQIQKIAEKLQSQPFGLKALGKLLNNLPSVRLFYNSPKIVGILNLTKDSFSDGGEFYDFDNAIEHVNQLVIDGADIIDIGAESTRPGAVSVSAKVQLNKILPVLKEIPDVITSIDTRSSEVAQECLKLGANIINDVSGFEYDTKMPEIIAKYDAKVVIQHTKGNPQNMQDNPQYSNLMDEIYKDLKTKADLAISKGIKPENIIIDPGIGFGKTRKDNFEIINRIEELYSLGYPVMLGVSRKSLLDMDDADNFTKDIYTTALNAIAINKKVDYIRVHNVKMHKKLSEMLNI